MEWLMCGGQKVEPVAYFTRVLETLNDKVTETQRWWTHCPIANPFPLSTSLPLHFHKRLVRRDIQNAMEKDFSEKQKMELKVAEEVAAHATRQVTS